MKKIHMFAALLAMLLPTVVFGGSAYHYARLTAKVSTKSSGLGMVYADKSTVTSAGTFAESSETKQGGKDCNGKSYTFNLFAQANEGYEFVGWSESDGGTVIANSNVSPWTAPAITAPEGAAPNTGSKEYYTDKTYYANFQKMVLASFNITFETSSAGTYTVDGAAPANKTGLTEATSVILKSTDANFLDWKVNGTVVNDNPYTVTCLADTTISAEFLTADQVTTVTTLSDLTAALSNAAYKKITIPSGTSITVAKGSTVTVPAGKQLVVDGTLVVVGTVSNSGVISGSGTLYKISYLIDQGEVQIVYQADETECSTISGTAHHAGESAHYYKTQVTVNTPSVTGTVSMTPKWGVLLNGETPYEISAQSVKGVRVNIDKTIAANKITSITGSLTSTDIQSGETGNSANWVLFSDCNLKGPARSGETTRLNFNGTIDLCGYTLTFGLARTYSDFYGVFLNGRINFTPSTDFQNGGSIFFNCSSINITKIKGTPTMLFYDCGTAASPATLSFSYQSGAHRNARIYSGYYSYSFNSSYDNGYAKVYGGSFTTNPSSYLADVDTLEVKYDGSKYYVVQEKKEVVNVVQIGSTPYETLEAAVNAAVAGDTISLIERVELTGTLTIPQGKNIMIALDKHTITGGKIVNRGTLVFTDEMTGMGKSNTDASGGVIESDIDNYGTLDFVFGTYSGAIVNKTDGVLTTHNGMFTGTFVWEAGTVNLKGGHFAADITDLATVDGCKVFHVNGLYSVCEVPDGTMTDTTISGNAGYSVTPYSNADFSLLNTWYGNSNLRTSYSSANWSRLAELLSFYQLFNNSGLDATLAFDRDVSANTIQFYTISGFNRAIDKAISAGALYRGLTAVMIAYNSSSKTYAALWQDNIKSVSLAVKNNSGANAGTVCAEMIELWESTKVGNARVTNTVYIAGQKLFTIDAGSNKAMIRPATGAATFYATLGAAMDAAADGGTVMLANDCDTALPLTKAGTYTFDTMGFAASDTVSVSDGLFVKSETTVDSSAKVLVPDAKATTYVVGLKVASVGGTFYESLAEAVAEANGAVVTLLAATDETITLTAEGQSIQLTVADGVSFNDSQITTSAAGCSIGKTVSGNVATYTTVKNVAESAGASFPTVAAAIEAATGDAISVTVTAATSESIELLQGKTLTLTINDGVTANVTVTPATGAFIETATEGATTTYVSKKITVEMAEPQASVEVTKIENGTESKVTDTDEINAAVAQLMGNNDVPRTDNTDKLDVLDVITVTPTKIVLDENGKIKSATFDVTPALNAGQSLGVGQKLKFRLPVDVSATQLASIVYHNGAQFGIYPVQTENEEKFIEVESDAFSPYGYELLDGETANPIAAIGTTGYATLPDAIAAASNGDTITVFAGTFDIGSDTIVVNKQVTITGAGKDTTTLNSTATGKAAFSIQASNVTIENMTINQADKTASNTTHIQIGSKSAVVENATVQDVKFTGSKYSLAVYARNLTVDSCDFVEPGSDAILLYTVQGTSAISDNTFIQTSPNGQGFIYGTTSDGTDPLSSGTLTISGNTASGGRCFYHCNNQNRIDTTTKLTLTITDNEIIGYNNKAIVFAGHSDIPLGNIFNSITITENAFYTTAKRPTIQRDDTDRTTLTIDASGNYWGAETPDFDNLIPGTSDKYLIMPHDASNIAVESWYQVYDEVTDTLSNLYVKSVPVAQVITDGGSTTNEYASLEAAFAAANEAGTATIKMLENLGSTDYTIVQDNPRLYAIDAALTNVSVTVAKTSNITLDLNGKTISAVDNTGANFSFIDNKGTFTVIDSTADANGDADGVLCYGSLTPDGSYGYGNYTINNSGTVTVESGTVMNNVRYTRMGTTPNNFETGASYPINSSASGADSWVYVNGGVVYNWATAAIRAFGNDSHTAHVVVSGGQVAGYPAIWLQNPNSSATSAAKIDLLIEGGEVSHTSASGVYDAIMSSTSGAMLDNVTITITGGTIDGYVDVGDDKLESSETVTITGGTFLTEDAIDCYAANDAEIGKIQISGGLFASQVPEEYCADGYIPTDLDPDTGKYTVKQGTYVAQIGTTKYETLAEAVAAATSGATIEMIADDRLTEELLISRSVTITGAVDENGKPLYTIYGKPTDNYNVDIFVKNASSAIDVTIQNVNISEFGHQYKTSTGNAALYVSRSTHADTHVLVSNVTFSAYNNYAIIAPQGHLEVVDCAINGYKDSSYGTFATGGIWSGDMFDDLPSSTVSVVRTSIINTDSNMPGVTGYAIDARAGSTVTVTDCTITNVHDGIAAAASQESGNGDASVSVSGTTVTAGRNALAITGNPQIADTVLAYLEVTSGMFVGAVTIPDEFVDDGIIEISGGVFDRAVPEDYCASGFIPVANTDAETSEAYPYTVKAAEYVAQIVRGGEVIAKYETFTNALEVAQSGDTVQLLADVEDVTETFELRSKNITIDGQGLYSITAGENTEPRSVVQSYGGARNMFVVQSGNVTFKDITLDGGETHYYTFLVQAKNGTTTFDNVSLLHGGEADTSGTAGVGYGAAVQVDGATVLVTNSFYACTGTNVNNVTTGVFPFTALLYQSGGIHFADGVTAGIGDDLLLVGMVGAVDVSTDAGREMVSEMLEAMNVPAGYYPYTLKLGDSEMTSFTGASPLGWNGIIDYGKEIMTTTSSLGMEMNPATTPVEVGLLTDTVLPDTFRFADTNFTVNGNGYALAGTIEYTDNAGLIHDIVMGTDDNALVLDMTGVTQPIRIGSGIVVDNVTVEMTAEQATAGTPVIIWDAAHGVDAPENEAGVTVQIVDDHGDSTGVTKELIWDDEMGMAYIGPVEARLTGPTHDKPIYTTLADAIARAEQTGDMVTLMMNVTNVTATYEISKQDLVIDGAGHKVTAAPVTEHRNLFEAWGGSRNMFKVESGDVTFRNIELDGDASHAYTFLISADNSGITLTTENVRLVNGGEQSVDSDGVTLTPGNGYGAAIHLNNGAHIVVSNGFYACSGGQTAGCFPFTAILVDEGGADVKFELTGNPNDPANVDIGDDLLLVGMLGDLINDYGLDAVQGMLSEMQVPTRFIPYTLTLADGSAYAFTGASPRRWNDIIDYGKDIMDVATANGFSGLDKDTTPVEVGLATDTILPAGADGDGYDFLYEDSNFSINGNGNALSGTIKFTDDADGGLMRDIELGTETNPLTLDLRSTDNPVVLGEDVVVQHVDVLMTEDQATLGKIVFEWDSGETPPDDEQGVEVTVVDGSGNPTGETKGLVWDEEYGVAYIGPVEARLTGTTHETPVYTSLANALDIAKDNDKVELLTNAVLSAVQGVGSDVTLDLAGYKVSVNGEKGLMVTNATLVIADTSAATNGTICAADGASPTSLIESGDGGVANIPTGIFAAASGGTVLATTGTGTIAVSGGYFSVEVLTEYCASGYAPMNAPTGAPQPYTVGETVPEFRYPIDGSVGVPVERTWLATYLSDIYSDPTKPVFANVTNDLVQALSENGANDMPRWESYVLGLNPTDVTARLRLTATSKDTATVTIIGLIDMTKFPKPDGTTITFRLAEVNLDGTKKVDLVTDSDEPSFDVLLEDVVGKELAIFADISVEGVAK